MKLFQLYFLKVGLSLLLNIRTNDTNFKKTIKLIL